MWMAKSGAGRGMVAAEAARARQRRAAERRRMRLFYRVGGEELGVNFHEKI
jgi:hypothetical protein